MKRSTMVLAAFAVAAAALASAGVAQAAHCLSHPTDQTQKATTHDPFGSCEDGVNSSYGNVRCGNNHSGNGVSRTNVDEVGAVLVRNHSSGAGVQACNDNSANVTPVEGRITVWRASNGHIIVSSDGDETDTDTPPSWTRADVRPGAAGTTPSQNCTNHTGPASLRRGGSGSYWDGSGGTRGNLTTNYCIQP